MSFFNPGRCERPGFYGRRAAVILVIAFVVSAAAAAAPQGGTIKGKVVADIPDQRKPLAGVVVYLSGERLANKKLQAVSDREGRFDFVRLIAGD